MLTAWMVKGPNENLIPMAGHWYRNSAISAFVKSCDWYDKPTWRKLKKDGFSVVRVEITEGR